MSLSGLCRQRVQRAIHPRSHEESLVTLPSEMDRTVTDRTEMTHEQGAVLLHALDIKTCTCNAIS